MKDLKSIRHDILVAAKALFAQYGYEKTSLSAITSAMGKSKTSIYYLFRGKEDIFKGVIEDEFEKIRKDLSELTVFRPEDPTGSFTDYIRKRISLLESAVTFRNCLQSSMKMGNFAMVGLEYEARRKFDEWEKEYFSSTCKSGQEAGVFPKTMSCQAFAETLSSLFKGVEMSYCVSGERNEIKTICETLSEILIHKNPRLSLNESKTQEI